MGIKLGTKLCEETKIKMSIAHIGKHWNLSEETKRKMSEARRGKHFSAEHIKKLVESRKGFHHSEKSKRLMSEVQKIAQRGNKLCLGRKYSEETKRKMSDSAIKRMERQLKEGSTKWRDTDIEILMYKGLFSRGYIIEKQKNIETVGHVDFYLPALNLVIECDGEYWHDSDKQKARDEYRNRRLKQLGYNVLRFCGNDIKQNLQLCLDKIL